MKVSDVSPKSFSRSLTLHRAATFWILGRSSTRNQSALHWYRHNRFSFYWMWSLQSFSSKFRWVPDVEVVIDTWSKHMIELLSRLVCQLTISFHTLLCMTSHVIRPWRNTKILREWKFFCSSRWNSRFEHGSVIVHNIFAYFTLSLSAAHVYMIKERCWFSQIDSFVEYFPHRIKILFLSSQFYFIHIHW